MKNLILTTALVLSSSTFAMDFSHLNGGLLGSKIGVKQLPSIIKSNHVYCVVFNGKEKLLSVGAVKAFKATATSRTRSATCNSNVKNYALVTDGVEYIKLTKSKLTDEAYKFLAKKILN